MGVRRERHLCVERAHVLNRRRFGIYSSRGRLLLQFGLLYLMLPIDQKVAYRY